MSMMLWVLAWVTLPSHAGPPSGSAVHDDPVLAALVAENQATMAAWEGAEDAPYYIGYRLVENRGQHLTAISGALDRLPRDARRRQLDVIARVGDYELDSTRKLRDSDRSWFGDFQGRWIPLGDDVGVLRHAVWAQTEKAVNNARTRIRRVRSNRSVKVEEVDATADFSREDAVVDVRAPATIDVDLMDWADELSELSLILGDHPLIDRHSVDLQAEATTEYLVTSEGTRIRQPRRHVRLSIQAQTTASDGMNVSLYRWRDVTDPDSLPRGPELRAWIVELRNDVLALREAPRESPWSGPILLRGAAAGVFVHEVIGHRVEGHRQEDEQEGQTFTSMVGQRVTDPTLSIVDDPTRATYAGFDLNGHYAYDQEGVPAQPARIVEDGVFRGFLLARDPIPGFEHSNGHGRAMVGLAPVARMANTIVSTSKPRSEAELRRLMAAELRKRKLPYGLLVDDLNGGFTMTGRVTPNAFNIRAVRAWRVYADGRPDELVRGVDLVGTPLEALRSIIAAGDDPGVFNGYCGAESGSVPNAAVSPSLLLRSLEVQKKETDLDRPPLLPKPGVPGGAS